MQRVGPLAVRGFTAVSGQPIKGASGMSGSSGRRVRAAGLFGAASAIALSVALFGGAASAEECAEKTIDLGDGKSVTGGCEPLKIAFLTAATNNVYLQAGIKGAQDAAAEIGATLD